MIRIDNPIEFKLHVARWNGEDQPLDVFVRSKTEWLYWNQWRGTKDEFSRDYIFSIIDFYLESDTWLFGGVYKVLERDPTPNSDGYTIEAVSDYSCLVGRLKIHLARPPRGRAFYLENYFADMSISEILKEPYSGESFPGYDNISYEFHQLEPLFLQERPDWKSALSNIKAVYTVMDKSNGKKYVGSAYGEDGLWSRWSCYIGTGHGWSDELTKLIKTEGIEYAKRNFVLTLLEYFPVKTDDSAVPLQASQHSSPPRRGQPHAGVHGEVPNAVHPAIRTENNPFATDGIRGIMISLAGSYITTELTCRMPGVGSAMSWLRESAPKSHCISRDIRAILTSGAKCYAA